MKDIGLAAEHYQYMKENLKKAKQDCKNNLNPVNFTKEAMYEERLYAFRLGLECAGILKEVEREWRRRYGDV